MSTPRPIYLTELKRNSRFFTTLTLRPGIYRGRYTFGGLTVEWEDKKKDDPLRTTRVHSNLLVIPAEWDNTGQEMSGKRNDFVALRDAPGADYDVA